MRLFNTLRTACLAIGCFALAALVVLPATQIALRGLGAPVVGMEELTRYFLIVVTFIGLPLVTAEGGQIRMDELHHFLPVTAAGILRVIIAIVSGAAFATVVVAIWASLEVTIGSATPTLGIPFWLFNLPALVGLGLGGIEFAIQAWRIARQRGQAAPPRLV
ncbi:MAG TPA: TRAP transporter small permease subunit [Alphaproteobacteria bacterium]|nr:TRAP transporter small permease subunit [Alphaproteobacteria bacterium]